MNKYLTRKTFKGLYAVLPTPFDRQGRMSTGLLRKMLNTLVKFNIDGIILGGTNGEFFSLEQDEKVRMTEIAAELISPTKINLVVGGTAISLDEQIKLGQLLKKAGAQALMNLVPTPPMLSNEEYCDFWKRLAEQVSDIGLVIYNLDGMANVPDNECLVKLAGEVPTICGTKEGHRDFKRWLYLHKNTDIAAMPANDYQWLEFYQAGCESFMTPSVALCPPLACEIHKGYLQQRWKETQVLQQKFAKMWDIICFNKLLNGVGGIAKFKAICRALGWIDPGFCHPPLIDVPEQLQLKLNQKIAGEFSDWCKQT